MQSFKRSDTLFSLCGLNCGLCPMRLGRYCPGCGGGAGNQPCIIAKCSRQHGNIEYCYLCDRYPCKNYDHIDESDSFITHRNQRLDFEKARHGGLPAYHAQLKEKIRILKFLLDHYNDGRRKSFFCLAVNLLDLPDLDALLETLEEETAGNPLTLKERAALAVNLLHALADTHGMELKLRKK